jgi:hypothetical protein
VDISINVTIPKEILSQRIVQDSIAQVMTKKTAPEVKTLFRKTVFGWANKPSFRQLLTKRAGYMSETIWADGPNADQYQMVNFGVPEHRIPKSGFTLMSFRPGYRASSTPRVIQSGRHYRSGPQAFAMSIEKHPGLKAREFDKAIAKEYEPTFRKDIQDAISVAAAKTAAESNK